MNNDDHSEWYRGVLKALEAKGIGKFTLAVLETWVEGDGEANEEEVCRLEEAVEKFIGTETWNNYVCAARSLDKLLYELGLGPAMSGGINLTENFDK